MPKKPFCNKNGYNPPLGFI